MQRHALSDVQQANVLYHSRLAPNYHRQPFLGEDNRVRVRRMLEDIQRRTGGRRLLDIGCGAGFIFDACHDLFEQLDGVDITRDMLAGIEPRPNLNIQIALAEALPFPGETATASCTILKMSAKCLRRRGVSCGQAASSTPMKSHPVTSAKRFHR